MAKSKIGYEKGKSVDNYGFPNEYPFERKELYYTLELGKRFLLDPISWIERPGRMPEAIASKNPSELVLLNAGRNVFTSCMAKLYARVRTLSARDSREKSSKHAWMEKCEEAIGEQRALELISKRIDVLNNSLERMPEGFELQGVQSLKVEMIETFNRATLETLGIQAIGVSIYRELEKINEDIKRLDSYSSPYIRALLEGGEGEYLIEKNHKTGYYQRSMAFSNAHNPGDWYRAAEACFKKHGLNEPNWSELGRLYIRQRDGTEYADLVTNVKKW